MGESLFSMRQFDEAQRFYTLVINRYPESQRVEAANYRLDLIRHIRVEAELLAMLQWSHEESLRTSEEFQRTIRTYEHLLNLYQGRIAELLNAQGIDVEARESEINWLMERAIQLEREIQAILISQSNDLETQESQINLLMGRAIQLEREIQAILTEHGVGEADW
jgi:hypothetical protein